MRVLLLSLLTLTLAPGFLGASIAAELPRGTKHFHLGMLRDQVDSLVAARGLSVISNGTAFLVCASKDSTVEFEQYAFFQAPHGTGYLWRVTIGYQRNVSTADYAAVRAGLRRRLGEPASDTWKAGDDSPRDNSRGVTITQQAVWTDLLTIVQLGARWSDSPDPSADRMIITWTDRRLQRLVEARRKKDSSASK